MKIYETAVTPSCRRVGIFLKEIGAEVDRVPVDVRGGENLSQEFLEKSVNGRVPVLELDDGTTICESLAICRYFDELHHHSGYLFGEGALEKALVEMWQRILEFQGLYTGFQAFRNLTGIYKDRENCISEWGVESKARVENFLPQLDRRLSHSEYVAGARFTVADITAYIFIGFAVKALEIDVLGRYPNIQEWFERLSQRDSFQP